MQDRIESQGMPVRYAGFWVRVLATILDGFILGIPIAIVLSVFLGLGWIGEEPGPADLLSYVLWTVVTVAFWVNWDGRTPGKKLLHIRIVSHPDGGGLSHGKAVLRYVVGYTVSTLVLGLGFIMVAFREDRRALHDLIAGTSVVYDE